MKWNRTGRGLKALGVSLAVGLGMTACSRDYTLGYLYVTAARTALISAYSIDYQSGALQQLADSPIPSGAATNANPVALVAAPNGQSLYVVNHDVSQVVLFAVGTDGKLYAQQTTNIVQNTSGTIIGSFPTSAAIDATGNFLFVTFTFQTGFTTALPGPGGVAVFSIQHSTDPSQEGKLGAPVVNPVSGLPYFPVGFNPVGVFANPEGKTTSGRFLYVVDQDRNSGGTAAGILLIFSYDANGVLSLLTQGSNATSAAGPGIMGFRAGTTPGAVAVDPTGQFIYITDEATNQLIAYRQSSTGMPTALNSSPFTTGQFPIGLTVDPRGEYVYVANFGSSTVSTFTIDQATGSLSGGTGAGVATGPTCVTIEPGLGKYLFTSNNIDSSVSGEQLDPHSGALTQVQGTQFAAAALPTCATAIANGAHPSELVN